MPSKNDVTISACPIEGLHTVRLPVHRDERGFFVERFHAARFAALGLPGGLVQDNHSHSAPGVLRGLHYQHTPSQGKLVGVTRGRIWDVAVDIRPDSPTYGRHHAVVLSAPDDEATLLFWIPPGFAHGFYVLGDEPADVHYKVSAPYQASGEGSLRYDDPALAIPWPFDGTTPRISARDLAAPSFATYRAAPPSWSAA